MSLAKLVSSQHSIKYTYVGTGTTTQTISAAQLISDCAAGPLKDLLNRVNTGVAGVTWANLLTSKAISLYSLPQSVSGVVTGVAVPLVIFVAGPNTLNVTTISGGDTVAGVIELRYHPSQVR